MKINSILERLGGALAHWRLPSLGRLPALPGFNLLAGALLIGGVLLAGRSPQPAAPASPVVMAAPAPAVEPAAPSRPVTSAAAPVLPAASVAPAPVATAATTTATVMPAPSPNAIVFRDARPVVPPPAPATVTGIGPATTGAPPTFRDTRGLAGPEFRDPRPLAQPSFRDSRPVREPAEAAPPRLATLVALGPPALKIDAGACTEPAITTTPLAGGQMRIAIAAACRANEAIQISYAGVELIRALSAAGSLEFALDCFAGAASPVDIRFADGSSRSLPVTALDLDRVSKIAVIWRAPVNLDLHVFEYAARLDQPGHVWAQSPSSLTAARIGSLAEKRGRGYLSAAADAGTLGDKLEVYTFLHHDEQFNGTIALALDHETRGGLARGAACGAGALAEVDFQVAILPRGGEVARQSGVLTRVACGVRLGPDVRFNASALPGLRIRR